MTDTRVIHPIQRLQHDLFVVVVPPPPSSPEDDPLIIVGSDRHTAFRLAAEVWSQAYPGETGVVNVYHAPLAMAALAGRVLEGGVEGIGQIPIDDRYRLVGVKLVPLPDPEPVEEWIADPRPRWVGPYARLLQQFLESGAPHARVNWKPPKGIRARAAAVGSLAQSLRCAARDWELPVTAVMRRGDVYLSRTDIEEPKSYGE